MRGCSRGPVGELGEVPGVHSTVLRVCCTQAWQRGQLGGADDGARPPNSQTAHGQAPPTSAETPKQQGSLSWSCVFKILEIRVAAAKSESWPNQ